MSCTRRLRIVHEPGSPRPWIVQYDDGIRGQVWKDAYRFAEGTDATAYVEEILTRDRALLEVER